MSDVVIETENLFKVYAVDGIECPALNNVSLKVNRGGFVAVAGPSGSGKSTLLNLISGLDSPTAGRVTLAGIDLQNVAASDLADFRRDHIGFIFQSYNLIPVLTVEENVEYVLQLRQIPSAERRKKVAEALAEVGMAGYEKRFPAQLSGGQQQRVAVARALVSNPDIILADEPTANLDSKTGGALIETLEHLNHEHGVTILFSTHDPVIMSRAHQLITLHDGEVASIESRSHEEIHHAPMG